MTDRKFFKNFKQTFEILENQAKILGSKKDLVQIRRINAQLHRELAKYKQLTANNLDLLARKENEYNQLLVDCIHSPPLNPAQYQQIDKQFMQLNCDIKALTYFIEKLNPALSIADYEKRLKFINEQIDSLANLSSTKICKY